MLMFSVLTLFFVYLANISSVLRAPLFFVSSIFIMGIMVERMYGIAFLSFAAVLFCGFLIVPDKSGMLPYLLFFGHYGIFKYFIDENRRGAARAVLKLAYFCACMTALWFFGGGFLLASLPFELPVWAVWAPGAAIFLLYDWLLARLAAWYYANLRVRLLGGRA
jgi:hypothetical protein